MNVLAVSIVQPKLDNHILANIALETLESSQIKTVAIRLNKHQFHPF
jgi:hypothetical protein